MPFEFKVPICKCGQRFTCKRCGRTRNCRAKENRHFERLCTWCCTELAYFTDKALPNQRIGDPQRNPVEKMLVQASVDCYLTEDEFAERITRLQAARYQKDLDAITADLQKISYPVQLRQRQREVQLPLWVCCAMGASVALIATLIAVAWAAII
jgi:hypothetical protein